MPLTDTKIRQLKPADEVYSVNDSDGLYLYINTSGHKVWKVRFTNNLGQRKLKKIGNYPAMTIKEARLMRDDIVDQKIVSQSEKVEEPRILTFSDVANDWWNFKRAKAVGDLPRGGAINHSRSALDNDILPLLDNMAFADVKRADLIRIIRAVEVRQAKASVDKICTYLKAIYKYAVLHEYCEYNLADNLKSLVVLNKVKRNYPHLKDNQLGDFASRLKAAKAFPITKKALRLMVYTGVRSAEVKQAQETQFDLEKKIWKIPPEYVKQLRNLALLDPSVPDYIIPLSDQAVEIVKEAIQWSKGEKYLFNSPYKPNQPLSVNIFCQLIRRMGYTNNELSPHGLRSTMSTVLNDSGLFKREWIEAQLSHADENKVRGTYNHAEYIEHRANMMQWWSDYLDEKFK